MSMLSVGKAARHQLAGRCLRYAVNWQSWMASTVVACTWVCWYLAQLCVIVGTAVLFAAIVYGVTYLRIVPAATYDVALPFESATSFQATRPAELVGGAARMQQSQTQATEDARTPGDDQHTRQEHARTTEDDELLLKVPVSGSSNVFFFAGFPSAAVAGSQADRHAKPRSQQGARTLLQRGDFTAVAVADIFASGGVEPGARRSGHKHRADAGLGGEGYGGQWTAGLYADSPRSRLNPAAAAALSARKPSRGWFSWLLGRPVPAARSPAFGLDDAPLSSHGVLTPGTEYAAELSLTLAEDALPAHESASFLVTVDLLTVNPAALNELAATADAAAAAEAATVGSHKTDASQPQQQQQHSHSDIGLNAQHPVDEGPHGAGHRRGEHRTGVQREAAQPACVPEEETVAVRADGTVSLSPAGGRRRCPPPQGHASKPPGAGTARRASDAAAAVAPRDARSDASVGHPLQAGAAVQHPSFDGGGVLDRDLLRSAPAAAASAAWTQPQLLQLGAQTVLARCKRRVVIPPRTPLSRAWAVLQRHARAALHFALSPVAAVWGSDREGPFEGRWAVDSFDVPLRCVLRYGRAGSRIRRIDASSSENGAGHCLAVTRSAPISSTPLSQYNTCTM